MKSLVRLVNDVYATVLDPHMRIQAACAQLGYSLERSQQHYLLSILKKAAPSLLESPDKWSEIAEEGLDAAMRNYESPSNLEVKAFFFSLTRNADYRKTLLEEHQGVQDTASEYTFIQAAWYISRALRPRT